MQHLFHKYTSTPVSLAAVFAPAYLPADLNGWLSIALQIGGGILIAVQIRYWWKKSG